MEPETAKMSQEKVVSGDRTMEVPEAAAGASEGSSGDEKQTGLPLAENLSEDELSQQEISPNGKRRGVVYTILHWTPKTARYDPASPPKFTVGMNLLFAFVSRY